MNNTSGAKLLISIPIRELEISYLDARYAEPVRWYLEHELGCRLTYLVDGRYLLRFPEGTKEETWTGRSTYYTRETTIRLPDGKQLTRIVRMSVDGGTRQVGLSFPNKTFE